MRVIYPRLGTILFSSCRNRRRSGRSSRYARKQRSSSTHSGGGLRRSDRGRKITSAFHGGERNMKHIDPRLPGAIALALALGACVTAPTAPTIPVVPGANKQFSAFA